MRKNVEDMGCAIGNVVEEGSVRITQQRKEVVRGPKQVASESVVALLPHGVPLAIRRQVQDAVEACVKQVLSAMASANVLGAVVTTGTNRITVSGDELMLQTASGVVIYLKRNRMTRLLLMLLCNPGVNVSRCLLGRAEDVGPWRLMDSAGNDGAKVAEDGSEVAPEDDCHLDGESCGPVTDEATLNACRDRLKEIGVLRKEAEEDGDDDAPSKLDEEAKKIRQYITEATHKKDPKAPTKIRLARPPSVKKDLHRLHAAFERVIAVIGEKDSELGAHLDCSIVRDGAFRYDAAPDVPWDIAIDALAAARANPKELVLALTA